MADRVLIDWRNVSFKTDDERDEYALRLPVRGGYSERVLQRAAREISHWLPDVDLHDAHVYAQTTRRTDFGVPLGGDITITAPKRMFEIGPANFRELIEGSLEEAHLWVTEREEEESTRLHAWLVAFAKGSEQPSD